MYFKIVQIFASLSSDHGNVELFFRQCLKNVFQGVLPFSFLFMMTGLAKDVRISLN